MHESLVRQCQQMIILYNSGRRVKSQTVRLEEKQGPRNIYRNIEKQELTGKEEKLTS